MRVPLRLALASIAALAVVIAQAQPAAPATAPAAKPYVIYVSAASRRLLEGSGTDLKTRANRWRDLLVARGASYTIATHPSHLASLPVGTVIVLPSAVVLDNPEREVIAKRLAAGDSLVATGMPGTLDAKGAPASADFVESTFQVKTKPTPRGEMGFLVTVGDTPLTHAIAPGTRVWIGKEKYAMPLLAEPGAGYLADWSRAVGETGLMTLATVGASRRVLLGWTEISWDGQATDFRKLAAAALDWAEGRPGAYLRTWPWPYRGAMTVAVDALWKFENAPRVASRLAEFGAHGSFHFTSAEAEPNAKMILELPKGGHGVGGFGDVAQPLGGRPEREQRVRIERMVDDFHRVLGQDFVVGGLRAPQGVTDLATEKAAASLDYLVDVGRIESLTPVKSESGKLVLLAASANIGASSPGDAVAAAIDEATSKALIGGYAFIGLDLAGLSADSPMDTALTRTLTAFKGRDLLWMGSASEIASWWRERNQTTVSTAWKPGDAAMVVDVTLAETSHFPAAIAIDAPQGALPVLEDNVAGVQLQEREGRYALVLTGLTAGTYRLRVGFHP